MRSQYGAFKQQLNNADWSISATSGGSLTAGTISFFIQAHNRVGLNLLSEEKIITVTSGQKIVITVASSAVNIGEDVFKFVISARVGTGNIVQIAEIKAKESNNETYLNFPLSIELTRPAHVATNISTDLTTGNDLVNGQFRTRNGLSYRYDAIATRGDIDATPGYWIRDDRGGFVNIASTYNTYGCDQSMSVADLIIPAVLSVSRQTEPITIWWANNIPSAVNSYSPQGTKLNFTITINGDTANSTNVLYRTLFDNRIQVKFIGYLNIETGELNDEFPNVDTYYPWSSQLGITLPEDLHNGYAAVYQIIIAFDHPNLESALTQGSGFDFALNLTEELTGSRYNPVATFLGNLVFNHAGNLRVVPHKVLPGKAIINDHEFTYTINSAIIGVAPDTNNQKVVISGNSFGLVQIKNSNLTENEAIRAIVSTENGTQSISFWSPEFQTTNTGSLGLTINLPIDPESNLGQIRDDYPDIIAGNNQAAFNVPEIIIFLKQVSTTNIYRFPPIAAGTIPNLAHNLTSLTNATLITENALPTNSFDFGLFDYLPIDITANPGSGTIPPNVYQVAIAYHYPEDNYGFTKISHSTTLGCIPELDANLIQAITEPTYWLAAAADVSTLKAINHNKLKHGAVVHVIEGRLLYWFNGFSTAANDNYAIIQPNNLAVGRFEFLTQIGSTLLSDFPGTSKGALLTINASGEETVLQPGANGTLLTRDNSTATGLIWRTHDFITSTQLPAAIRNTFLGAGPWQVIAYDGTGTQLEASQLLPEIAYSLSNPRSCIPLTIPGNGKSFAVLLPPTTPLTQTSALIYGGDGSPYGWANFTLAGLDDTYPQGTVITHGSQLIYDSGDSLWKPVNLINDVLLAGLNDVYIDNPASEYPLIWDAQLNKFVVGMPNLTAIDGIQYNTNVVTIPGDTLFTQTRFIISARQPGKDLTGNLLTVSVINATTQSVSPYGVGSAYRFEKTSRQLIQIPTTENTLLGSGSFCIETWFRSTELIPGNIYTIAGRNNNTQADFWLSVFESSAGVFNVRFRGYDDTNTEYFSNSLSTSVPAPGLQINTWYHIAVTRNGNEWRIFLNGQLQQTITREISLRTIFGLSSAVFFSIGRVNNSSFTDLTAFVGNIEDFRLTVGNPRYIASFSPPTSPYFLSTPRSKSIKEYYLTLTGLLDVDSNITPQDNYVLAYHAASLKYRPMPLGPGGGVANLSLGQLTNVDLTGATTDNVLALSSTGTWIAKPLNTGITAINSLTPNNLGSLQLNTDNIPQGLNNRYLTTPGLTEGLGNLNLEALGNVADTVNNGMFLQKVNGIYQGSPITIPVTSINGKSNGAIELTTDDIAEGVNANRRYYTNNRVKSDIAVLTITDFPGLFTGTGTTGQTLSLNASGKLTFVNPSTGGGGGSTSLGQLIDVNLTGAQAGYILQRNNQGVWVATQFSVSLSDIENLNLSLNNLADVVFTELDPPQEGDVLRRGANNWTATTLSTDDLVDGTLTERFSLSKVDTRVNQLGISGFGGVFANTGTTGQIPSLNSSGKLTFINAPSGGAASLDDLNDVTLTSTVNNQFLRLVNGQWVNITLTADMVTETVTRTFYSDTKVDTRVNQLGISSFGGIFASTGTTGQIPSLNSSGKLTFINAPSGGAASLDDLNDVTLTSTVNNQFLRLVNGQWVNITLTADMVTETVTRTFYSDTKVDTRVNQLGISSFGGIFAGTGTTGQIPSLNSSGKLTFINAPSGGGSVPYQTFKTVDGNYTLIASDHGNIILVTNTLGVDTIILTLPTGMPAGFQVTIFSDLTQLNAAPIQFSATSPGVIKSAGSSPPYLDIKTAAYATHVANNVWIVIGALL